MMRLIAGCLLVCLCCGAGYANWPEFRGPHGDGRSDAVGLPVEWSTSQNVVWSTPVRGRAWSSPVVWGDRIWMTSASEDGKELYAIALDATTGKTLHDVTQFTVAVPQTGDKFNSYASPTPAIEEGRVYLSWGSAGLACLDSETAETLWVRRDFECNHFRGPGSSPILWEDLLFLPYDGYDYQYVAALDKQTGDTVWLTRRPHNFGTENGDQKKAYATPQIIEVNGQPQLLCPTSKGAFSYDPRTGEEIWRVRYTSFSSGCRPLYHNGLVYISTGFGKSEMVVVDASGTGDVTDTHIRWQEKKSIPSKPSPVIVNDRLYMIHDQGVASCLDAATGDKVWQDRVGGNYSASPITGDGMIYFFSEEGKGTVIEAADEFRVLAVNELNEQILASPAVVENDLLIRTKTRLYRIGGSGDAVARTPAPGP